MQPELRLVRYFVAVAEEGNVTRAAARLRMAQPPLSAAVRQLEGQLGVRLLERAGRGIRLTPAGEELRDRGRALLAHADEVYAAVRARERDPVALLRVGVSPAARAGLTPALVRAWSERVPGVMVHLQEDTTGALLRGVADGRLDRAVAFCPPPADGVEWEVLREEPAVVHVRADHPFAARPEVAVADLAGETLLVAGGRDSPGYSAAVAAICRAAGIAPATRPDPYPDLGLHAVREGLGIAVYVATAFDPAALAGWEGGPPATRLVPLAPPVTLPFHLVWRPGARGAALDAARAAALACVT